MDNGEGDNVFGEFGIEAVQGESDHCLGDQAEDRGLFASNSVDDERIKDGSKGIGRAVLEQGKQTGIQRIDSEVHKTKHSLNDDIPGEMTESHFRL